MADRRTRRRAETNEAAVPGRVQKRLLMAGKTEARGGGGYWGGEMKLGLLDFAVFRDAHAPRPGPGGGVQCCIWAPLGAGARGMGW